MLTNIYVFSSNPKHVCCKLVQMEPFVPRSGKRNRIGVVGAPILFGDEGKKVTKAQFGEFPHMCILITYENESPKFLGGASLIASDVVLTAAHILHSNYG